MTPEVAAAVERLRRDDVLDAAHIPGWVSKAVLTDIAIVLDALAEAEEQWRYFAALYGEDGKLTAQGRARDARIAELEARVARRDGFLAEAELQAEGAEARIAELEAALRERHPLPPELAVPCPCARCAAFTEEASDVS